MKRKVLTSIKLLIIIGLLFAACSNSTVWAASGGEKKVVLAIPQEPTTLDPSLIVTGPDFIMVENWGEYLLGATPSGELKPRLVTTWKMSPDGKKIDFTLRKGIKFHSGDMLTARDVEFSFNRGLTKNPATRTTLALMERFEVLDDYRFTIHFKTPDVSFIPTQAGRVAIVSKSYYERVGEDKFVRQPVGTGPYKVVHYASGEYFDLERFEEYWGEKPSVKQARVYFVPEDTTRMAKIQTGEVDLIVGCPYPSVRDMEKRPGLKVVRLDSNHPSPSVIFANRNPKVPWYNQKVRLAMAHAIDWNAIVKNLLHGIPNHWPLIAPYELGYDPNLKPYTYDPKKAKELLNEAGFSKGFEFKLYYPITGRIPMVREIAEAIASYFEVVGIRTKLVGEEFAALLARRRASKTPEAEFVYIFSLPVAGGPTSTYFLSSSFTAQGNTSVYFNPTYESVINEARATVDETKRAELVRRAVKILNEDVALIPIFNMVTVFVMKESIDFKPTRYYTDPIHIKDITVK